MIRGHISLIHPAGGCRLDEAAVMRYRVIEPEAAGEVIAVKAVSSQDTTGNVAAQTALTDDVDLSLIHI